MYKIGTIVNHTPKRLRISVVTTLICKHPYKKAYSFSYKDFKFESLSTKSSITKSLLE